MWKFSLRDLSLFTVIFALCLGLGVNQYRMSTRLAAVEKHNARLTSYSREMRFALEQAQKADQEWLTAYQVLWRKIPNPPERICGNEPGPISTFVDWKILKEPEPQIGFKRAGEF